MIILSNVNTITLDVSFNSDEGSTLFVNRATSKKGFDYFFKYGQKKTFNYDVNFTTFSEGRLMNEWWVNNQELTLQDIEGNTHRVQIASAQMPFTNIQARPYQDLYRQPISLSEV